MGDSIHIIVILSNPFVILTELEEGEVPRPLFTGFDDQTIGQDDNDWVGTKCEYQDCVQTSRGHNGKSCGEIRQKQVNFMWQWIAQIFFHGFATGEPYQRKLYNNSKIKNFHIDYMLPSVILILLPVSSLETLNFIGGKNALNVIINRTYWKTVPISLAHNNQAKWEIS